MWARMKLKNWIVVIAVGMVYSLWCNGARSYFGSSWAVAFGLAVFGVVLAVIVGSWAFFADGKDEDDDEGG